MLPGLLISTLSAVCAIIEHGLQTVLAGAELVIAGYRCQGRLWGLIDAGAFKNISGETLKCI